MTIDRLKLRPPRLPARLLERGKLTAQLGAAFDHRVSLICAPAGYGKTWLVSDWLGFHADRAQIWVSLDDDDNDAVRLWSHVGAAAEAEFGRPLEVVAGERPDADRWVDEVASYLAREGAPVIVVLDDIHLIEHEAALASIERFWSAAADHVTLVVIGRHDPMLPLGRLRLEGDLLEIRAAEMELSVDETAELLNTTMGLQISEERVARIRERTRGWMAGVRLAALSAGSETRSAHGHRKFESIADYLVDEVFAGLEPEVQIFLLETSPLSDLSGALCDAVTGRTDSHELLAELARSQLFVSRMDDEGGWYRYHDLFRELLQVELRRSRPDRMPEIHADAARWLHGHGHAVAAVHHAIAGSRFDWASDWTIEVSRFLFATGQIATLMSLVSDIDERVDPTPLSVVGTGAIASLMTELPGSEIDRWLGRIEKRLAAEIAGPGSNGTRAEWPGFVFPFNDDLAELLATMRAVIAHRAGDVDGMAQLAGHVPTDGKVVEAVQGVRALLLERHAEAQPFLESFAGYMGSSENTMEDVRIRGIGLLALLAADAGDLARAERLAAPAVAKVRELSLERSVESTYALIAAGEVAWERGELADAETHARLARDTASHAGEVPSFILASTLLGRIRSSRGEQHLAGQALDRAAVLESGRVVVGPCADRIALERARLHLLASDLLGAELALPDWRARIERGAVTPREHLVLGRMLILAGEDPWSWLAPAARFELSPRQRLELGLARAHAARAAGDDQAAFDELSEVMSLAARTGHRQRLVDERAVMGSLLDSAAATAGVQLAGAAASHVSVGFPEEQPVIVLDGLDLAEPFTEREMQVLRLLPSHLTYQNMADELHLSVNTIKYHVKAVYRKLGAPDRATAVDRARAGGILSATS